ncbi:RNA uridylyltransferase [Aureococcus anophagefferens]|nr:RNA uridylyltransferase [Aureococcus anophagefferens]
MAGQPPPRLSREARGLAKKTKEERTGARRRRKTGAAVKRERKALAAAQAAGSPPQALTPTLNPHVVAFVPDFSLDDAPRDFPGAPPAPAPFDGVRPFDGFEAPAYDDGFRPFDGVETPAYDDGLRPFDGFETPAYDDGFRPFDGFEAPARDDGFRPSDGFEAPARDDDEADGNFEFLRLARTVFRPGPPAAADVGAQRTFHARNAAAWASALEEEERAERSRRRAWAVEAIAGEQRRRVSDTFLLETASTRWFEELVNAKTWDDDYEVVCPYACFGCGHACARSGLVAHLASCPRAPASSDQALELDRAPRLPSGGGDEDEKYLVVCPNAVMGCGVSCRRGEELSAHLASCPFSDVTREREERTQRAPSSRRSARRRRPRRRRGDGRRRDARRRGHGLPEAGGMTVELFGSCAYGLDFGDSDLDLVVVGWDALRESDELLSNPTYVLHRLAQYLRAADGVRVDKVLDKARVPVVRAVVDTAAWHPMGPLVKVDISLDCAGHSGLAAAALCERLVSRLPELAPAALAVRCLLAAAGLNDAYTGGLPSYAVLLMVFYSRLHAKRSAEHRLRSRGFRSERTLRDDAWRDATAKRLLRRTSERTPPSSPARRPPKTPPSKDEASSSPLASPKPSASFAPTLRQRTAARTPTLATRGALYGAEVADALLRDAPRGDDDEADLSHRDVALALLDFLELFGLEFAPESCGFSVRRGGRRLAPGVPNAFILIEDPLEPSNNVGRNSYNVGVALELFAPKYDEIRDALLKLPAPRPRSPRRPGGRRRRAAPAEGAAAEPVLDRYPPPR